MTISKFMSDKVAASEIIVRTDDYEYIRSMWNLLHPGRKHVTFSKMLYKEDGESSWSPGYDSGWYLSGDIRDNPKDARDRDWAPIEKLLKLRFFGAYIKDQEEWSIKAEGFPVGRNTIGIWKRPTGDVYVQRGVNSGHLTPNDKGTKEPLWYRSRGLFVLPEWRKKGLGQLLLQRTIKEAIDKGCSHIWSYPNESAISVYLNVGFTQESDFQEAEFGQNCYVLCKL